jgi:hypothetical protein
VSGERLEFELDHEIGIGAVTAHGGVPALIEHFRSSGAAAIVDAEASYKQRRRGLSASQMSESLIALWAAGGEPAEDLERLREGDGLALLLGHALPAAQTARDFLASFDAPDLPLLGGGAAAVRAEGRGLRGLAKASAAVIGDLQRRRPAKTATIDLDATVLASSKQAAKWAYDGRRGYQPVVGKRPARRADQGAGFQFQGSRSLIRLAGWALILAMTSASHACGSSPLSLAVSISE